MKRTLKALVSVLALAGICATANSAVYLDAQGVWAPDNMTWIGATPSPSPGNNPQMLEPYYKFDAANGESGDYSGFYQVTSGSVSWPRPDPAIVLKDYQYWKVAQTGPEWLTDVSVFYAKMGNNYVEWDLTGLWDGKEDLYVVNNFVLNRPDNDYVGLSHIQFTGTPVPEPTTMIAGALLLLPFGVSTLRLLRRKTS